MWLRFDLVYVIKLNGVAHICSSVCDKIKGVAHICSSVCDKINWSDLYLL